MNNNEEPLIEAWCVYKWHYKTLEEHQKAFEDNEFGLQTLVAFYPTYVYLMNNYDDTQQLDKRGIEWDKRITYSELKEILYDGSIERHDLYDWA